MLIGHEVLRILRDAPVDFGALKRVSLLDPMGAAATMTKVMEAQTLEAGPALAYVDGSFFC